MHLATPSTRRKTKKGFKELSCTCGNDLIILPKTNSTRRGGEVWAVTQTPSEMDVGPRKSQNYFDHLKITNATQGNTDNSHNPSKQA